jgi:hypothetical protein
VGQELELRDHRVGAGHIGSERRRKTGDDRADREEAAAREGFWATAMSELLFAAAAGQ